MVKIVWENQKALADDILNTYKEKYRDYFEKIKIKPSKSEESSILKNNLESNIWSNKLFWGDNLDVIYYLLNYYEETIDLIYIDPPFYSGKNYYINIRDNNSNFNTIAYHDHWHKDLDSYLQMLYERIVLLKKLLSKKGLIFVHLDWHASHYVKLMLDEVFGHKNFVNNIIWYYYNKYSSGKRNLPRAHDDILVYSKTKNYTFKELRLRREKPRKQLKRKMVNGVLKNVKDKNGHVLYRIVVDKKMDDVWRIPCLQPASKQWTGFPTQKHHKLLERIIKIGSNKDDLIADFFCGSGATLLAAEKLNRRWIGCDISEYSIYLSWKRIFEFQKKLQKTSKNLHIYPFEFFTNLNENHKEILNSGFFEKELIIKRKKENITNSKSE
jgi:adenine specific DNA methylase Mod